MAYLRYAIVRETTREISMRIALDANSDIANKQREVAKVASTFTRKNRNASTRKNDIFPNFHAFIETISASKIRYLIFFRDRERKSDEIFNIRRV